MMFRILAIVVSSFCFPPDYPSHRPVSFRRVVQPSWDFLCVYISVKGGGHFVIGKQGIYLKNSYRYIFSNNILFKINTNCMITIRFLIYQNSCQDFHKYVKNISIFEVKFSE